MSVDLANWMSNVGGSRRLSELSIPGTHDSATTIQPGLPVDQISVIKPSVRLRLSTQTRGLRAQLEGGNRFLDLRCGNIRDGRGPYRFELYHEDHALGFSFAAARDICQEFLKNHPGETIVVSIKEEDEASKTGYDFPTVFFDTYVKQTPGLWFLQNRIPRLAEVRGKLVLFRRFITRVKDGKGIDAYDGYPDNKTDAIPGPPRLEIQDDYGITYDTIEHKKTAIANHLQKALVPGTDRDSLYVNFTSAAGVVEKDYPIQAAAYLNPWVHDYFSKQIHGRFGILPRDFEGVDFRPAGLSEAVDATNSLIIRTNPNYFFLKNQVTEQVADFKNGEDGTTLIAYGRKSSDIDNQVVEFIVSDTPPYFILANRLTGTVIDIQGGTPARGNRLIAATLKAKRASQLWMLEPSDQPGQFRIASKIKTVGVIAVAPPPAGETNRALIVTKRNAADPGTQLWSVEQAR